MNNRELVNELMKPIIHVASDAVLFVYFMGFISSLDNTAITNAFISGIEKLSKVCQHIIDEHDTQ